MASDYHHLPEIRMTKVGMQTLRTAIWRGTGEKRPLMFFNGIGANLEIAQPLAEDMTDRDVITFDMPGIGGSPKPVAPYRPWWVAHAAKQILIANGYDDAVDVLGVSWGGGAAQQFAFQYKARVSNLVLCATSPGSIMVPGDILAMQKMAHPMRYTDQTYLMKHFETLYGDEPDGARLFGARMKPPSIRGYLYQLGAMAGWSALPFLPFLPHRTLVMAGDKDKIVPLANAQILKFMIPNAELEIFEDGGHLFLLTQAEKSLGVLRRFLDGEAAMSAAAMQAAE